jgi:DNA mismatch endonuclease (patch repair protein)
MVHLKVPRSPPPSSVRVTNVMKANKGRDTLPERILRTALSSRGVRGYRLSPRGIPGRPDIVFRKDRLAVFVNGCFWHRCPRHSKSLPKSNYRYWSLKFRLNKERDARKNRELRSNGWKVLVFWECEVRDHGDRCALKVEHMLSSRSGLLA